MDEKSATKDRILTAAMARIRHYGYGKTTMAEIAADCEMSPGNIYRFFEFKLDIAEAMARRASIDHTAAISAIAQRKDLSAEQRLRQIFLVSARRSHAQLHDDQKTFELVETLGRERPLYFREVLGSEAIILAALVQEGIDLGQFAPCDAAFMAETLQVATARFSSPRTLYLADLPALERNLNGLLDLVFSGLKIRSPQEN